MAIESRLRPWKAWGLFCLSPKWDPTLCVELNIGREVTCWAESSLWMVLIGPVLSISTVMLAKGFSSRLGNVFSHKKSGGALLSLNQFQYGIPIVLSFKYLQAKQLFIFATWLGVQCSFVDLVLLIDWLQSIYVLHILSLFGSYSCNIGCSVCKLLYLLSERSTTTICVVSLRQQSLTTSGMDVQP